MNLNGENADGCIWMKNRAHVPLFIAALFSYSTDLTFKLNHSINAQSAVYLASLSCDTYGKYK